MTDITSFENFHREFEKYHRDNRWMYRGQAKSDWSVVPKAGRQPYCERDDLEYLESWARRATEFIGKSPENIWEAMALAQHHGLPTRLLDWSYNPLVAAFFACLDEPSSDGIIYCYMPDVQILHKKAEPQKLTQVMKYRPNVIASRIGRQSGLFSVHPKPKKDLRDSIGEGEKLTSYVIKASYKQKMLFELNHYGINRLTFMGDLDGLSVHMRWTLENRRYWSDHNEFMREMAGDTR
ncbi:MAG: FRG domain-containing protein [Methylobacter sp.]